MQDTSYNDLERARDYLRSRTDFRPRAALVLGSGLGDFAEGLETAFAADYRDIPGFPVSGVAGHKGRLLCARVSGVPTLILQGRVHYYEGYTMAQAVLPVRLAGLLGAEILVLTNAAGGINRRFAPGELMRITGHIASFVPSPLTGPNPDELGPRFPDMTRVYDPELGQLLQKTAAARGLTLREGVYVQTPGPQYETPEEIRMFALLGADAVGMSTACEAIAARHMGLRVAGLSCISNMAAGITGAALTHSEVAETAARAAGDFKGLLLDFFAALP